MLKPRSSYRYLKPEDRMTIASLMQQNYTQRDIAKLLSCSASTVAVNWGATLRARHTTSKVHNLPASIAA